jgi:AcrR family transcriptional regulator
LSSSAAAQLQSEKANGPRSSKGARTRARLIEAAQQVFEETGFLDARITDIADRAGLSHGSFYHYFDSKEQIFREVAEVIEAELSASLRDVILARSSELTPHDRLAAGLRYHYEVYRSRARIMGVIEQVSRYDDHIAAARLAHHRDYATQMAESIRQLQERDLADRDIDAELVSTAIVAMVTRFAEMWLAQGAFDAQMDEVVDQLARVMVNALQIKQPATRRARKA